MPPEPEPPLAVPPPAPRPRAAPRAAPVAPHAPLAQGSVLSLARRAAEELAAVDWFRLDQAAKPPRPKRVVDPVFANEGVRQQYQQHLIHLLDLANLDLQTAMAGVEFPKFGFAQDASPTQILAKVLKDWGKRTIDRFNKMSTGIAADFAEKNHRATEIAMQAAFKRSGWTVKFKPTKRSLAAYQAVIGENVGLIRSIGEKYHTDVQTQAWSAVRKGGDLRTLSIDLQKTYGVSSRRAALIARDQNAKAKAIIEATRDQELGITHGIWQHSHAGKEPRPVHVRWGLKQQVFELKEGLWDPDEEEQVWPGTLINCRCTWRPIIEGFEM